MIPIYINCRDRVTELCQLVAWLEAAGEERIVLIDNASTWGPLRDYLKASPHEVIWLGHNAGSRSIWTEDIWPDNEPYIFTDPDLIPIQDCPYDLVQHLAGLLDRYPHPKAGVGLFLDDLPEGFHSLEWERNLVSPDRLVEPGVYHSLVDTTFAVYRAGQGFTYDALRTGFPYQVRHPSWYISDPDAENRHYLARAIAGPSGSSWAERA